MKDLIDSIQSYSNDKVESLNGNDLFLMLLEEIKSLKNESELRTYYSRLSIETIRYVSEYNRKVNNNEDVEELSNRIEIYNLVLNTIKDYLSKKEQKSDISNTIIRLLEKYYKSDKSKPDSNKLLLEVFNIREQREKDIRNNIGYDGVKILFEIESLEDMASRSNKDKRPSYELTEDEFIKDIKKILYAINEYNFLNDKISYFNNITNYPNDNTKTKEENDEIKRNKYLSINVLINNMIISLFGTNIINITSNITFSDLIAYLSRYNLVGGYSLFEEVNKDRRLGNNIISKKEYEDNIFEINKLIDTLCDMCRNRFKDDKITINDYSKTQEDYKKDIQFKYNELRMLVNREAKGVHR